MVDNSEDIAKQMWIEIKKHAIIANVGEKFYDPNNDNYESKASVYRVSKNEAAEYNLLNFEKNSICDVCKNPVKKIPVPPKDPIKEDWFHTAHFCPKCMLREDFSFYNNNW